jgi:hypothetical protein
MGTKAVLAALGIALVLGAVFVVRSSSRGADSPPHVVAVPSSPAAEATSAPVGASTSPLAEQPSARLDEVAPPAPPIGSTAPPPVTATARAPRGPAEASPTTSSSTTSSIDALREESALVASARAAVRRGDGAAALALLETARVRHPKGVLLQEREVLAIEALAQTNDAAGASRRASAFLRAFPTSPHASHVRTFVR